MFSNVRGFDRYFGSLRSNGDGTSSLDPITVYASGFHSQNEPTTTIAHPQYFTYVPVPLPVSYQYPMQMQLPINYQQNFNIPYGTNPYGNCLNPYPQYDVFYNRI